jgi:uncharacterized protein YqgC (DUF456 family)
MIYFWLILLILLNAFWLFLVLLGLPGNWMIIITTCLFAWWQWDAHVFSIYTLIFIAAMGGLGELIEFFAAMGGARKAGAGWAGAIAALIGAIIGGVAGTFFILIPFLGTLIGACIGAGLGAWGIEFARGKKMQDSVRYGVGAGMGRFVGTAVKFGLGILIWIVVAVAAFWP